MATIKNTRNINNAKSWSWGSILLSFAAGAFTMFLLQPKDEVIAEQKTTKTIAPTFDFYTLLPEMEVVVNSPQQTPTKGKISYMLQVGSFRKAADADSHKNRLILLGIEATVQTVTIDGKDTWHRVQVGPISGREQADQLQKQLKQKEIESLLMIAKHS